MDPLTGVATRVVTEAKARGSAAKDLKPTIILVDAKGKQLTFPGTDIPAAYTLPPKSIISVEDGDEVGVGGTIARLPQEASQSRDITGGQNGRASGRERGWPSVSISVVAVLLKLKQTSKQQHK